MDKKWTTREVLVGSVTVGGSQPVRIQSMTTSKTRDIAATIDQVMRLADMGCEIVRVTVQGMKEAEACEGIKSGLIQKGYTVPLVADIHFFPPAALCVADFVEKVRINPGNFVDKRASFKQMEYDEATYALEIERIEEKFTPLVDKCKRLKRAMRIGANHGSLSDRIMNRFGDTPRGMVESALEFARVCRALDYHDFMFSMKSSNPKVMIAAYRLLVEEMMQLGWDYPLHLGVTEAGEGEDGRIKSAMGIGSLLLDGIGDTIRVSLTEDPWHEIDPCQRLIRLMSRVCRFDLGLQRLLPVIPRRVEIPSQVQWHPDGVVWLSLSETSDLRAETLGWGTVGAVDGVVIDHPECAQKAKAIGVEVWGSQGIPMLTLQMAERAYQARRDLAPFALFPPQQETVAVILESGMARDFAFLKEFKPAVIIASPREGTDRVHFVRELCAALGQQGMTAPVVIHLTYSEPKEDLILKASAEYGALLCDGLGQGIWLSGPYDVDFLRQLSLNILQAARMRMSKTDFISCPSCGRTLFDLQEVSERIRSRTAHLPGVKIAIMGCIVNGPGEMADADFGYVGSKPGMIDLYVGKTCVQRDISFESADERLIDLIKEKGRWIEA